MNEMQKILEEQFLAKRVQVKIRGRDNKGKILAKNLNIFDTVVGICTFIGPNEHLNIPLQINLDNDPIFVEHISHVSLAPEMKPSRKGYEITE